MIDKVLSKFLEAGKWDADTSVKLAIYILKEVTISGYIPFTSPAPSSTEKEIRDSIRAAIRNLDITLELMETLYGKTTQKKSGPCGSCRYFEKLGCRCMVKGLPVYERSVRNCFEKEDK